MADDVPFTVRQFARLRRFLAEHTDRSIFYCPDERLWVCVLIGDIDIHVSTDLDLMLNSLEALLQAAARTGEVSTVAPTRSPDLVAGSGPMLSQMTAILVWRYQSTYRTCADSSSVRTNWGTCTSPPGPVGYEDSAARTASSCW